jgi:hypothetical protein
VTAAISQLRPLQIWQRFEKVKLCSPRSIPPKYILSIPHWLEKSFWLQPSFCREDLMRQPSFNSSTFSNEAAMGFKLRMKAMTGLSADSS